MDTIETVSTEKTTAESDNMNIEKIMSLLSQKKLNLVRNYHYEICFILLLGAVGFLAMAFLNLDSDFRAFVVKDHVEMREIIKENTQVLRTLQK